MSVGIIAHSGTRAQVDSFVLYTNTTPCESSSRVALLQRSTTGLCHCSRRQRYLTVGKLQFPHASTSYLITDSNEVNSLLSVGLVSPASSGSFFDGGVKGKSASCVCLCALKLSCIFC